MTKSRTLKFIVGLLIMALGIWYFWLKGYNYKVTFTTATSSGLVYDHLTKWNDGKTLDEDGMTLLSKTPFTEVIHHFGANDSLVKIRWDLKMKNDSTTFVTAKIKDENNPIFRNIQVIWPNNDFTKQSISTVKRFAESLLKNKEVYKLSKVEKDTIPSKYAIYVPLKSSSPRKANTMLAHIGNAMNYIKGHNIPLDGHPFLEVTEWNIENDSIQFNFCFPIKKSDNYPPSSGIKFKKTEAKEALKIIFNGNYKISDRAWFALKDYARFHDIEVEDSPVEVFLNDPHSGTDALGWSAEVYLPLKE